MSQNVNDQTTRISVKMLIAKLAFNHSTMALIALRLVLIQAKLYVFCCFFKRGCFCLKIKKRKTLYNLDPI